EKGEQTAYLVKREGVWKHLSYNWAHKQVQQIAFGMRSLGFKKGTRFALLAENSPEWSVTDFGAMAAGYVIVPLYTTLIPSQIEYILNNAETKVAFVSNKKHLETILSMRDRVPSLEKIVVFSFHGITGDDFVISLDTLKKAGAGGTQDEFEAMAQEVDPQDKATFVYTSGTTGNPKGVTLTHKNFEAEFEAMGPLVDVREGDRTISFLPLSHILQRVVDTLAFSVGVQIAYVESLDALGQSLKEVKPTFFVGVPRVYEKIHGKIMESVENGPRLKRALFNFALNTGREQRQAQKKGRKDLPLLLKFLAADKLVLRKLKNATGGRVRTYVSAGAPLSKELGEFFDAVGFQILEAYGMTELTGAVTMNTPEETKYGTVGKAGPGVELKIAEDGEVCVRGGVVMSEYWKLPEDTLETIDQDGWLHTGDIGDFDEDGFLRITDRKKEIIVTAAGKNVAPQPLENALKADKFVSQVMVIGDKRNFISAMIVPEKEVLLSWAKEKGVDGSLEKICKHESVCELFSDIVAERMVAFSKYERVKAFRLIPDEFTENAGELTPTLKLKRRVVLEKHKSVIDEIYSSPRRSR
ncbi:MAG: long-chain fatty acid--CoA ligase, partial [Pseudomonadota bacterium]